MTYKCTHCDAPLAEDEIRCAECGHPIVEIWPPPIMDPLRNGPIDTLTSSETKDSALGFAISFGPPMVVFLIALLTVGFAPLAVLVGTTPTYIVADYLENKWPFLCKGIKQGVKIQLIMLAVTFLGGFLTCFRGWKV